jgi:hypothetical protein
MNHYAYTLIYICESKVIKFNKNIAFLLCFHENLHSQKKKKAFTKLYKIKKLIKNVILVEKKAKDVWGYTFLVLT